jgi:Ca-activated chloride channel family protein
MCAEVQLIVQTNRAVLPVAEGQQLLYVLVETKPTSAVADVRMPLNFSLVLDHSGSMSGAKLDSLKEAAKVAVGQMGPQDLVSIVVFDDKVEVVVPSGPVTDVELLNRRIDRIRDGGGTEMSRGMRKGLDELRKGLKSEPDRVSRMLLLTDGETFGDEEVCRQLAVEAEELGITVAALGLGEEWNEQLLDDIAQASGGSSDFVPAGRPDVILDAFYTLVQSAQTTVVRDADMILRLVAGVTPRAVWRVRPMITRLSHQALSDRDVQVHLGDMDREQGQSVLVEMLIPPRQPGTYRVAQAEVSYDVAATDAVDEEPPGSQAKRSSYLHRREKADVIVDVVADPAQVAQSNPYVMNVVEKVTAHKLQTRALDEAGRGDITGATQKLRAAATRLLALGEEELAQTALEEADRLDRGEDLSARGTKKLRYETRKLDQLEK